MKKHANVLPSSCRCAAGPEIVQGFLCLALCLSCLTCTVWDVTQPGASGCPVLGSQQARTSLYASPHLQALLLPKFAVQNAMICKMACA